MSANKQTLIDVKWRHQVNGVWRFSNAILTSIKRVLVEVYKFADDLKRVRSLHFLIRDRVENEVVFSFRVLVELKFKEIVKNKLTYKLGTLQSEDKYVIDPAAGNRLEQYVAWQPEKRIVDFGQSKFNPFIDLLKILSSFVAR